MVSNMHGEMMAVALPTLTGNVIHIGLIVIIITYY